MNKQNYSLKEKISYAIGNICKNEMYHTWNFDFHFYNPSKIYIKKTDVIDDYAIILSHIYAPFKYGVDNLFGQNLEDFREGDIGTGLALIVMDKEKKEVLTHIADMIEMECHYRMYNTYQFTAHSISPGLIDTFSTRKNENDDIIIRIKMPRPYDGHRELMYCPKENEIYCL